MLRVWVFTLVIIFEVIGFGQRVAQHLMGMAEMGVHACRVGVSPLVGEGLSVTLVDRVSGGLGYGLQVECLHSRNLEGGSRHPTPPRRSQGG
jgi:hypothetical protein